MIVKRETRIVLCLLMALICSLLLPATAFADGVPLEESSDTSTPATETTGEQLSKETVAATPTAVIAGEPLSEDTDISTRDMLYDKNTNKQFITVTDRDGNVFYLMIDYDAPTNEDEEQYKTYFLNPVDIADLMALAGENKTTPAACSCTEKCVVGSINTACEVCAANMTECAGQEPIPETTPEPVIEEEPQKAQSGVNPAVALIVLALIGGGIAFALYKLSRNKPKTRGADDLDEYDYGEDEDETEAPWETEDAMDDSEEIEK